MFFLRMCLCLPYLFLGQFYIMGHLSFHVTNIALAGGGALCMSFFHNEGYVSSQTGMILIMALILLLQSLTLGKHWCSAVFKCLHYFLYVFMSWILCSLLLLTLMNVEYHDLSLFNIPLNLEVVQAVMQFYFVYSFLTLTGLVETKEFFFPMTFLITLILGSMLIMMNEDVFYHPHLRTFSLILMTIYDLAVLIIMLFYDHQVIMSYQLAHYEYMLSSKEVYDHVIESQQVMFHRSIHNVKNHMIILRGFIEDHNTDEALTLLNKELDLMNSAASETYTGYSALDAIIYAKRKEAAGIAFSFDVHPFELSEIKEMHIALLMGLALDNAIEATHQDEMKEISIGISQKGSLLFLKIVNGASQPARFNQTTKEDKRTHGFGIKIMKEIIDMYNGTLFYAQNNGYVTCYITLSKHQEN